MDDPEFPPDATAHFADRDWGDPLLRPGRQTRMATA